jgi:hypothetical protein
MPVDNLIDAALANKNVSEPLAAPPTPSIAAPSVGAPVAPLGNLIDSALGSKASSKPGNLIDSALGSEPTTSVQSAPRMQPATSSQTAPFGQTQTNLIDAAVKKQSMSSLTSLSDEERKQSSRLDPENNEDEPWYSKTWDWMNKPLWDLHQYGTRTGAGSFERGIESGAEDLISGLSSPLSIALTIGTLGEGTLAKVGMTGAAEALGAAPATLLRAVGVSREAAPFVAKGIKSLIGMGFTAQNLQGFITQSPKFLDALREGDYETAARLGTSLVATGGLTLLGAHQTFEDASVVKDAVSGRTASQIETLKAAKKIAGKLDEANAVASDRARTFADNLTQQLKSANALDETTQGAIRKYMLAQGDTQLLQHQHDALAGTLPVKSSPNLATEVADPKVKDFGSKNNFQNFVEKHHNGDVDDAKAALAKQFDVATYTDETGNKIQTPLKSADQIPTRHQWNQDYVYHAVDVNTADLIRNSGIRKDKLGAAAATPEEALNNASLPASGNKGDLHVFAVPRSEVESGKSSSPRNIMPSHEVVVDSFLPKDGSDNLEVRPTGQVVPLRPDSPYSLSRDNARFESEYTPEEKQKLLDQYKAARNLTPEQKAIADTLRNFYDDGFNKAHDAGIIRQAVEAYHPQAWAKDRPGFFQNLFANSITPTENSAHSSLRHQTDNGAFDTNISAAKHRAFETEFQGEMAGYKSKTSDLVHHAANYQNHLERAMATRQFIDDMRASGAKASDGRPLVAMQGSSNVIGQESGNPALLVNPNAVLGIAISNDVVKSLMDKGQLEDLINSGKIERLPFDRETKTPDGQPVKTPAYAWSTDGYQTIDHPSMRDWQYIGKDSGGNNALLKASMRIHPEAADYIRQVVGADKSVFREKPYLRALMAAQREMKGALLSFSPFHAVQEGLRGVMLGINPLKGASGHWFDWRSPVHVENDPLLRLGVRNNLTFPDYHAQDMFSDGVASHSKFIGSIPVAGKLQNYIQEFTFDKLIPGLKARAFKSVYSRFLEKMPGAGADEVAHQAATYVNDVFGGQHWRDLGVSASGQDFRRAVLLAPDWLTSEVHMLSRAAGGMGSPAASIARQDMLRLTAGLYVTARVVNMLSTGQAHPEAPFGLVVPGKKGEDDKVYSMRTLPTDLLHVMSDPRGFVAGRLNPLTTRTAIEGITGRNERGQKVTPADEFEDAARNFVPIGVQGLVKGNIPGQATTADQLIKAAGASVYKYRTEAEKLAQEKASDHMPSGPVDPEQLAKHHRNIVLEDGLRNGEVSPGEIVRLLPQREATQIIQNSKMTPLQARFNRLPLKDAVDVWALATATERDQLHKLLWDKRRTYMQSHTPAQRRDDSTWLKLQSVYADLKGR